MKEIQMFPQITEETEENLLNIEEVEEQPLPSKDSPSPPSSKSSSSLFESVTESPPKDEGHVSGPVPKIVAEDVDVSVPKADCNHVEVDCDWAISPQRIRMRSLSGGAYRPVPGASGRMRRQSGDDVLTAVSPSRRPAAAFFDAFRPRSKSDSKSKKPTFLASLRNSIFSNTTNQQQRKTSLEHDSLEPLVPNAGDYRQRSRSGSETRGGTMSKMIDMFRNRSNSISIDQRNKKPVNAATPGSAFLRRNSVDPERRRHHSSVVVQRSLELPYDSYYASHHRSETMQELARQEDPMLIPRFFDVHTCYDIIPKSGKVIVLDVNLEVEKAFHSLVGNMIRAAPLWSGPKMNFVGMLTITDFIDVLILYYNSSEEKIKDLAEQNICTWRSITKKPDNFIHIHPDASLTDAIKMLVHRQVHRLPVYDPTCQSVLFILTHKRILKYFYLVGLGKSTQRPEIFPLPSCLRKTLRELRIGTYENIATATLDMTVIEALKIFFERKISALPVLQDNELINIYAKFDVLALANEQTYRNPHMTIREALERRGEVFEKVVTCTMDDTLHNVLDKIVDYEVHRIVIVSNENTVIGMISLSDILKFLVLKPLGLLDDVPVAALGEIPDVADPPGGACASSSTPSTEHVTEGESIAPKEGACSTESPAHEEKPKNVPEDIESEGLAAST